MQGRKIVIDSDMNLEQLKKQTIEAANDVAAVRAEGALPIGWNSQVVLTLSISILLFGLAVLGIMAFLICKQRDSRNVLRAFGVPLIIVAAIFLVVTGYSQEQIAPVIGLLGTIAGYLLGVNNRNPDMVPSAMSGLSSVQQNTLSTDEKATSAQFKDNSDEAIQ